MKILLSTLYLSFHEFFLISKSLIGYDYLVLNLWIIVICLLIILYREKSKRESLSIKLKRLEMEKNMTSNFLVELNHRTKNCFLNIKSMLKLKLRNKHSKVEEEILKETIGKLNSINHLFNGLDYNGDSSVINTEQYLNQILKELHKLFSSSYLDIELKTSFQNIEMEAKQAMKLGMILTELFFNSVKHRNVNHISKIKIEVQFVKTVSNLLLLSYNDSSYKNLKQLKKLKRNNKSDGLNILESLISNFDGQILINESSEALNEFTQDIPLKLNQKSILDSFSLSSLDN